MKISIKKFQIKLQDQEELINIPHDIFLKKNVILKEGVPTLTISLVYEYMMILEKFFSNTWFSLDGKNFYRSSMVTKIIVGDDTEISIINPIWTDDVLTNFTKVEEVSKTPSNPVLLVETSKIKEKLSFFREKINEH